MSTTSGLRFPPSMHIMQGADILAGRRSVRSGWCPVRGVAAMARRPLAQHAGAGAGAEVLLVGADALREVCTPCGGDALLAEKALLLETLEAFRTKNGFGRGIAAPQIGITRRFIAINLGDRPQGD